MQIGVGGEWPVELWDNQNKRVPNQAATIFADIELDDSRVKTRLQAGGGIDRRPDDRGGGRYIYTISAAEVASGVVMALLHVESTNPAYTAVARPAVQFFDPANYSLMDLIVLGQGKAGINEAARFDSQVAAQAGSSLSRASGIGTVFAAGTTFIETEGILAASGAFSTGPPRTLWFRDSTSNLYLFSRVIENHTLLTGPSRGRFEWPSAPLPAAPEVGTAIVTT